jgi:hypothetical protein
LIGWIACHSPVVVFVILLDPVAKNVAFLTKSQKKMARDIALDIECRINRKNPKSKTL